MDGGTANEHPVRRLRSWTFRYRSELLFALFFLFVTIVVFRDYFEHANPLGTDSMGLPFIITASQSNNEFFSTWISFSGMGFPDYPLPVYQTLYMVATTVGISALDVSKILMVSSFWLAGVAMFICAKRLSKSNIAAITAAAVFSLNQVYLSQIIDGHYYFVLSYALFPLIFLIFYNLQRGNETKLHFLAPLVLVAYGTMAPPNIVLITVLFLALFTLSTYFIEPFPAWRLVKTAIFIALIIAFLGLSVVLANNIPTYNTSYPIQEAQRWSSPSLMDGLTVKASENSFFYGNETDAWVQPASLMPLANTVAFIVPLLAFSSLIWKDHRRSTIPLAIISLLFIFLAKGPYEPMSGAFNWIFTNLPLFDTIRVYSRFSLFTGFAYGLMIAFTMIGFDAKLSSPSTSSHLLPRISKHKGKLVVFTAAVVGVCLLVQSGAILSGTVGSFDLPLEYQQPFDWAGDQEGDFRILNLPYMADYHNAPSLYGYPNTTTIDPGIYSLMYTGKDTVYGSSTYDFWSFFDLAMSKKSFGYRETASIMGTTSSMRYVVIQPHTSAEERSTFLGMEGLNTVAAMEGGGLILENENWSSRASAFSNISMVTGGRDMLLTLVGMKLYEPGNEGLVFLDQLTTEQVKELLDMTDHIYVANGDLTELYMELSEWPSERSIMLSNLGASHTTDDTNYWVQTKEPLRAGLTLSPTLVTTGKCNVTVTVEASGPGSTLYLKLLRGPEAGKLSISMPGLPTQTFDANYPVNQMAWVEFQMPDLSGPIQITFSNNGDGLSNLEQLVVTTAQEMESQKQTVSDMLAGHVHKLVYVYSGMSYFGEAEQVLGTEGWGAAPAKSGGTLHLTAGTLFTGQQKALVVKMNGGDPVAMTVQGQQADAVDTSFDGEVFDVGQLAGGEDIGINTTGLYGAAIMTGDWVPSTAPPIEVHYEKLRIGTYRVNMTGQGPYMLQLSENYNSWWGIQTNESSVIHVPINSIVNGYLLKQGNTTVIVEYGGKTTYTVIIGTLGLILVAAATLIVIKRYNLRKKGSDG